MRTKKSPVQTEASSEPGSYYPQGEDCLNLNVPQTYRIAFQLLASLMLGGSAIAWLFRRRKGKH